MVLQSVLFRTVVMEYTNNPVCVASFCVRFEVVSVSVACCVVLRFASLIRKCFYKAKTEKGDFPFKSNVNTYIHVHNKKYLKNFIEKSIFSAKIMNLGTN